VNLAEIPVKKPFGLTRLAWINTASTLFFEALPKSAWSSGLANLLLLYDLRSGLGDATFYEISLNLELLLRAQVHHGVEGQVAG
jgi:hypothetical protein